LVEKKYSAIFSVSCCNKVLFENHLQKNGFYEKDGTSISTGPIYKNYHGDQMLYYGRIVVDSVRHNGWIVGSEVGFIGVSNLVIFNEILFLKLYKNQ
jgi:hypothetical protein